MDTRPDPMDAKRPLGGRELCDLIVVLGIVLGTLVLIYWAPAWLSPLRVGFGLISVLFVPGYVTVVILIPYLDTGDELISWQRVKSSLSRGEQVLLSIIISIAIIPMIGIVLSFTSPGVRPATMVLAISGYSLVGAGIAAVRRLLFTSTASGFLLDDINSWISRLSARPTETDLLLNLLLITVILIGGLVVIIPDSGQGTSQFTEFYVLSEDESGALNMTDYLRVNDSDDPAPVVTGITNHEQQTVEYTVIVQVQRAEVRERSVAVLDRSRISTINIRLAHGESARIPYEFRSPETQTGCRVAFLLYRGNPPSFPTVDNAYRELHLWDTANPPPDQAGCSVPGVIDVTTDQSSITVSDES